MVADMHMARTKTDRHGLGKHSRRSFCLRLQPLLVIALACTSASAFAQDGIRRCIGENGEPVFSDRPCTTIAPAIDARATPRDPSSTTTQTCATSASELRERVVDAFAMRNALALSGLLLWDGYGGASATSELQSLARLVVEPLVAVDLDEFDTPASLPSDEGSSVRQRPSERALTIRTARDLDHVPQEARTSFELVDHGGCWWLRPGQ
jgi:hypothetical protein